MSRTTSNALPAPHLRQHWRQRVAEIAVAGDFRVLVGFEHRTDVREYQWHGRRRPGEPRHPRVLFQATVRGWGRFQTEGRESRVGEGQALVALLPSNHEYGLSPEALPLGWEFFWVILDHPYLTPRLNQAPGILNTVHDCPLESPLFDAWTNLHRRVTTADWTDPAELELACFQAALALERSVREATYPTGPRERLLREVRSLAEAPGGHLLGVTELARALGQSRGHFTERFHLTTGLTPAAYLRTLRLEAAAHRLVHGGEGLKAIAAATGFTDATHLCRRFREHFGISPGEYRMRHFSLHSPRLAAPDGGL